MNEPAYEEIKIMQETKLFLKVLGLGAIVAIGVAVFAIWLAKSLR